MVFCLRKQQILVSNKKRMFNYPSDLSRFLCSGSVERYSPSCKTSEEGMYFIFYLYKTSYFFRCRLPLMLSCWWCRKIKMWKLYGLIEWVLTLSTYIKRIISQVQSAMNVISNIKTRISWRWYHSQEWRKLKSLRHSTPRTNLPVQLIFYTAFLKNHFCAELC